MVLAQLRSLQSQCDEAIWFSGSCRFLTYTCLCCWPFRNSWIFFWIIWAKRGYHRLSPTMGKDLVRPENPLLLSKAAWRVHKSPPRKTRNRFGIWKFTGLSFEFFKPKGGITDLAPRWEKIWFAQKTSSYFQTRRGVSTNAHLEKREFAFRVSSLLLFYVSRSA